MPRHLREYSDAEIEEALGPQPQWIGWDPGFGNCKVAAITEEDEVRVAVTPSALGAGVSTDLGMLEDNILRVNGARRPQKRQKPDHVRFADGAYLVGPNVSEYTEAMQRLDFRRLGGGPAVKALFYDAMYHLLGEGEHHRLFMMVGLPVEIMEDRERAQEILEQLRRQMIGFHEFDVNQDRRVVLNIEDLTVMTQPAGTFFAWGLNNFGSWVRDTDDLKGSVAVADLGFNTLDLFVVSGGRIEKRFTGGDTAGMRRAAEFLKQKIQDEYGVKLDLNQADALIRDSRPELSTWKGLVDLSPLVQQALDVQASKVVQFVTERWAEGRNFTHILFTGGGSEALRDVLVEQYPHGIVLREALTANVQGMAKYARRVMEPA